MPQSIALPRVAADNLVVIAASSGGLDALHTIFAALPADFGGAIAVVQHRLASHASMLCELLSRWTPLDVRDAREGDEILVGTILIAPADRHMTVTAERTIALVAGDRIHYVLSSAEPLFATAAAVFGAHLTAVVITGGDGDGSTGVRLVKQHGGTVIAQDPATAHCPDMPRAAIATGVVDYVLPLDAIAPALIQLVGEAESEGTGRPVGTA